MKNAILAISLIAVLAFASCPSPGGGAGEAEGSITINFNTGERAAAKTSDILPLLEHKVTLTNGPVKHDLTIAKGETSATIKVAAGTWKVTVEAYYDSYHFATGENSVDVKAGVSNPCSVPMKQEDESAVYFMVSTENDWKEACYEIGSPLNPGGNYVIFVTNNISVNDSLLFLASGAKINVTICGNNEISPPPGELLNIGTYQTVTLQDVKLVGSLTSTASLVYVSGGEFIMKGSASVSRNTNTFSTGTGGGVYVDSNGTFTMKDNSSVSDNFAQNGGGVYVNGGTFTMQNNSSVSGNKADYGGGVYVLSGTFHIQSGTVVGDKDYNGLTKNTVNTANGGAALCAFTGVNLKFGSISQPPITANMLIDNTITGAGEIIP
jgi:hypothetical protein